MLIQILFIATAVECILASVKMLGALLGNDVGMPLPLLHFFGINASNVYVLTPAIAFQVWYWSQPLFAV